MDEGGRYVICNANSDGSICDVIGEDFNARTTVHEYGGGSMFLGEAGVFFSNFKDQRLYIKPWNSETSCAITKPDSDWRYSDGEYSQNVSS